jgi:hypothetical protein
LRNREKERVDVEGVAIAEWWTNRRRRTRGKQAETDRVTSAGRRVLAVPSNDPTFLTRPKVKKPCRRKNPAKAGTPGLERIPRNTLIQIR